VPASVYLALDEAGTRHRPFCHLWDKCKDHTSEL